MGRLKITKMPKPETVLIPVVGSKVGEWPGDIKEIEVEDGAVFTVSDYYSISRTEEMYPESLVFLALGVRYSQAEIWKIYRRENIIFFFVSKLLK